VRVVPAEQRTTNNRFSNTTPLPPRLHPHSEGTTRGSVARPTLHRPHERALVAESRGRIELALFVLQERAYLNDIYTRVSQVDGGRGEQCGGHKVPCFWYGRLGISGEARFW